MVKESIKDIINQCPELHYIEVSKPDKRDKSTWTFNVPDRDCTLEGCAGERFENYRYQMVTLRRENHYFLAYKFFFGDDLPEYYVDPRKAMHRATTAKYIDGLVRYLVFSNDVSTTKNEPSFKVAKSIMLSNGINNFLDLCFYYKEYSAIGTGLTRDLRNLVVMDIDVDCTKEDNKMELDNLILRFAKYGAAPDFYVFNKESRHVQLQWLIKDFKYKEINNDTKNRYIEELNTDSNKHKEINLFTVDFTQMAEGAMFYRKYTISLCNLVKKRKFGDRNYTFWKAKNPMSALMGFYGLELKMPYLSDGEIKYKTKDEMLGFFINKKAREIYYANAPTMEELYGRVKEMVDPCMKTVSDKKIEKMEDDDDVSIVKESHCEHKETARDNFVLACARFSTWDMMREMGLNTYEQVVKMDDKELDKMKSKLKKLVKKKFEAEDRRYGGNWPDTSNHSAYSREEFNKTFNRGFNYALMNVHTDTYTDEQREKSLMSRSNKKYMKILLVEKYRNSKMTRDELLKKVNDEMVRYGQKKMSFGSLKRYISELDTISQDELQEMRNSFKIEKNERKKQLKIAVEAGNQKLINAYRKRLDYLNVDV